MCGKHRLKNLAKDTQSTDYEPHQTDRWNHMGEEREVTLHAVCPNSQPVIQADHYSSFTCLKRVTAWVTVFVTLSVKAVHLELVSNLTSQAFIAALRCFISHHGKPSLIWSDNGTNFTGASRELRDFYNLLKQQSTQQDISECCSCQGIGIHWKFIPEHAPYFGWHMGSGCEKHENAPPTNHKQCETHF